MYVDGDVEEVDVVDVRRLLEGPVLVVARRKEVLSDMALQLMFGLYVAQSQAVLLTLTSCGCEVAEVRQILRRSR